MVGDVISGAKFVFEAISSKGAKSAQYKKDLMQNFVEPLYAQLETVHKEYVTSLQNYRTLLAKPKPPLTLKHPIFAVMQKDHALSETDRAKLVGLSQHLDQFRSDKARQMAEEPAGRLAQLMVGYVTIASNELTEREVDPHRLSARDWASNAPRRTVLIYLEDLAEYDGSDAEKKSSATKLIDSVAEDLQSQYLEITRYYMDLKADLLA